MGFIRGGLLILVSILLLISFLLGSVFWILSWSLEYENVQAELGPIAKELTGDQFNLVEEDFNLTSEMGRALEFMREHCQNETSYVFAGGGYTFVLPCSILEEIEQEPEAIVEAGISSIVENIYYEDYECGFWDCFGKTQLPVFLISEKAKNYWQEKFYYSLIAALVLIVLIFFLVVQKQNEPILVGSLLALSSLPLMKLEEIVASFASDSDLSFISIFFSKTGSVFWIMLISGLIILGIGIALRFWNPDFLKTRFSRKDVKRIVKKETDKK